jgi:hypothetical protein
MVGMRAFIVLTLFIPPAEPKSATLKIGGGGWRWERRSTARRRRGKDMVWDLYWAWLLSL